MRVRVLAAAEPLTPVIFLVVSVMVLVHVTMRLARRTGPLWGRPRRPSQQQPSAGTRPAVSQPSLTAAVAGDHSRWTSPGFWRRMDADLVPLSPAERDRLLEERIAGLSALRKRLAPPENPPHTSEH